MTVAKLDKFLELLVTQKADALELVPNKPASLLTAAGAKPMTKDPLTAAQIAALVREIAPMDRKSVAPGQESRFEYASPSGQSIARAYYVLRAGRQIHRKVVEIAAAVGEDIGAEAIQRLRWP